MACAEVPSGGPTDLSSTTSALSTSPVVVVYSDGNYAGVAQQRLPGRYDADQLSVGNDSISSIKVPPGWTVTLYGDGGFSGPIAVVTSDMPSLPASTTPYRASSFRAARRAAERGVRHDDGTPAWIDLRTMLSSGMDNAGSAIGFEISSRRVRGGSSEAINDFVGPVRALTRFAAPVVNQFALKGTEMEIGGDGSFTVQSGTFARIEF